MRDDLQKKEFPSMAQHLLNFKLVRHHSHWKKERELLVVNGEIKHLLKAHPTEKRTVKVGQKYSQIVKSIKPAVLVRQDYEAFSDNFLVLQSSFSVRLQTSLLKTSTKKCRQTKFHVNIQGTRHLPSKERLKSNMPLSNLCHLAAPCKRPMDKVLYIFS